jgi:hypothetical protein
MDQSLKDFFKAAVIVLYTRTYIIHLKNLKLDFIQKQIAFTIGVKSGRNYPEKNKGKSAQSLASGTLSAKIAKEVGIGRLYSNSYS